MFSDKNSDFLKDGSLKSNVSFSFCGELSGCTVRRWQKYSMAPGKEIEPVSESYFLDLQDRYGFSCSLFRRNMTQEKAYSFAAKIPLGQTIIIDGKAKIVKGKTYFNATVLKYPDESPILAWSLEESDETKEEIF